MRRIEGGRLSEEEIERLGEALYDLDQAIEKIKADNGIEDAVAEVKDSLDQVVDDLVGTLTDPDALVEKAR
jgi:hypothetical protein